MVIWRKASGQLPHERVKHNNSSLQLLNARKLDADWYICSATNLLGNLYKKTLIVIVSNPRFTVKPPVRIFAALGDTLTLGGALVIRDITKKDAGHYICTATSAGVFDVEALTHIEVYPKGQLEKILKDLCTQLVYLSL